MNVVAITPESIVNGDGLRTVIWMQGCQHHCEGCHNPSSWEFCEIELSSDWQVAIGELVSNPLISGITISGGEPLAHLEDPRSITNLQNTLEILKYFEEKKFSMTVWLYTGYTWEELMELSEGEDLYKEVLSRIDVLVEGSYKKDFPRGYMRGSINQRIILCKKSLESGALISYENDYYKDFKDVEES